jgi:hypothetical protein
MKTVRRPPDHRVDIPFEPVRQQPGAGVVRPLPPSVVQPWAGLWTRRQRTDLRSSGSLGLVMALLDGVRIEVTERPEGGWSEHRHRHQEKSQCNGA